MRGAAGATSRVRRAPQAGRSGRHEQGAAGATSRAQRVPRAGRSGCHEQGAAGGMGGERAHAKPVHFIENTPNWREAT